jgi:hypothetical protein
MRGRDGPSLNIRRDDMKTVVSSLLALSVLAGIAAAPAAAATYGWSAPSDFTVNGSTGK